MTKKTISELEIELAGEKAQTQFARDKAEERGKEIKDLTRKVTTLKRIIANNEAKINRTAGYLDRVQEVEHPERRAGSERRGIPNYHHETSLNPTFNHDGYRGRSRDPDEDKEWFEL